MVLVGVPAIACSQSTGKSCGSLLWGFGPCRARRTHRGCSEARHSRLQPRVAAQQGPTDNDDGPSTSGRSFPAVDPYVAASLRLQSLLAGAGDGSEQMEEMLLSQESPETKLQNCALFGGTVAAAAVVITTLIGKDPWGGASLSPDTAAVAAAGLLASLPMAAARLWSWSPAGAKALPALEDMQRTQVAKARPWLADMQLWQAMALMAVEVLPTSLLLFPMMQGGVTAGVEWYGQVVSHSGASTWLLLLPLPLDPASCTALGGAAACVLSTLLSGLVRGLQLGVSQEEMEAVEGAVANADRYYRLVAMDVSSREADAATASHAFKSVAQAWLSARYEAAMLAGLGCMLDVLYLEALWHVTGDFAAVLVAALVANGVDCRERHLRVLRTDGRGRVRAGVKGKGKGKKEASSRPGSSS